VHVLDDVRLQNYARAENVLQKRMSVTDKKLDS
jgi:hypothetical protein